MQYATGDICCNTSNGPYLRGLNFLEGVLIFKFCASSHTLLSGTKVRGSVYGLMRLCKAFCASALDSCNSLSHSCTAGTESSGMVSDAVGLRPMINSCGV
jgi:hypothetical protein